MHWRRHARAVTQDVTALVAMGCARSAHKGNTKMLQAQRNAWNASLAISLSLRARRHALSAQQVIACAAFVSWRTLLFTCLLNAPRRALR